MNKRMILTICILASLGINAQKTSTGDGDWSAAATWSPSGIPTASDDVTIASGHLVKIKVAGAVAKSITATGKLQINAEKSLEVAGDVTTDYITNILFVVTTGQNMGTLIFGGVFSGGNISAKMRLPTNNNWHLISSPFKVATIEEYINGSTTIVTNAGKYSLATYNDANTSGSKYTYYESPLVLESTRRKFEKGQGYSTKLNNTGDPTKPDVQFKGKLNDIDVTYTISDGGSGFNLVGNPFPAYLYGNENSVDVTNNILTGNTGVLEEPTLWFWDNTAGGGDWVTKNQSDGGFNIAPLQGFFVKAKTGGGGFKYTEAMQTHTKTNGFYRTSNSRFEIDLSIANNDTRRKTSIRYIENKTTSFDNGYDSSLFSGLGNSFAVYTELVDNNTGKKLAIQSLPNANFEEMVIPVGVNASAGSEITFTADVINVPTGYKVYLEDRINNTLTRLDETNAAYKTTVSETITTGRFYLHARTSSVLNADTEILNSVSIYKTSNSNLKITGLQKGKTIVSLYNILGKQVLRTSFEGSNVNDISLPKLATGIYIVKLQAEIGELNKKIILE